MQGEIDPLSAQTEKTPFLWDTDPPDTFPFQRSGFFSGIEFTGRYRNYTNADTWYPTWAEDGNLTHRGPTEILNGQATFTR
ncbi:hypothetical protein ACFL1X_00390 [Candidatus Hydrogenedentota bacterium]